MVHIKWSSSLLNVMDILWYFTPIPFVRKTHTSAFDWIIHFYCWVYFCCSCWQSIFSKFIFLIVRAGLTDDLRLVQEKNTGILHWCNISQILRKNITNRLLRYRNIAIKLQISQYFQNEPSKTHVISVRISINWPSLSQKSLNWLKFGLVVLYNIYLKCKIYRQNQTEAKFP